MHCPTYNTREIVYVDINKQTSLPTALLMRHIELVPLSFYRLINWTLTLEMQRSLKNESTETAKFID